jgi:hypothetical protein
MKKLLVTLISLIFINCATTKIEYPSPDRQEITDLVIKVAGMFSYYDELDPNAENNIVGDSEIEGQCSDYALAFVNLWNEKYPGQALLVIQNQSLSNFPDGLYKVVGKDGPMPSSIKKIIINNQDTSMLYFDNSNDIVKIGLYHPELGNYKIRLVKKLNIHFHIKRIWDNAEPHVWVMINDISIDPTWADTNKNEFIGQDIW